MPNMIKRWMLFVLVLLTFGAQGQVSSTEEDSDTPIARLTEIRTLVLAKRQEMESLTKALKKATDDEERQQIQRQLDELPKTIKNLAESFEQLAIGGIDLSVLSDAEPEDFDWQKELVQITRPLLGSLRELTEKPRKIEQLRSAIARDEARLRVVNKALGSLNELRNTTPTPPKEVVERLNLLATDWQARASNLQGTLEVLNVQIASLKGERRSTWNAMEDSLHEFVKGRGLTLLIALGVALTLWWLTRLVMFGFSRLRQGEVERNRGAGERLMLYISRIASAVLVAAGVLIVFYMRGDMLLMALGILLVVMLAVSLRSALPKFINEIRMLLDLGGARTGERLIYGGIPMQVKNIGAFVTLHNPELEGVVRLPVNQTEGLFSRPSNSEPWFPCRPDEFVMLEDGRMAKIMRQTVENVDLRIASSIIRMATADFLGLNVRNLSRTQYGVPVVFGLDYRHQNICLTLVPEKLKEAVAAALDQAELSEYLDDLLVEFKEAGANSLDYIIYATFKGSAAEHYFSVGRIIQRACVETCNREGWEIPFAQLKVHAGEGFVNPAIA